MVSTELVLRVLRRRPVSARRGGGLGLRKAKIRRAEGNRDYLIDHQADLPGSLHRSLGFGELSPPVFAAPARLPDNERTKP